jgi:putative tryptophan/tyrosine transport system substrate-binding protein
VRVCFLLACALALPAPAQEEVVYRIGMLETTPESANRANLNAFLRGMREQGYVQGKNMVLDYRSVDGRPERFRQLAADMVRAKPHVIVTRGSDAARAARDAGSVPVVMATSADPVAAGLVTSLARPGGHVTGLTTQLSELSATRIRILRELAPKVTRVAVLQNMANPTAGRERRQVEQAAWSLGLQAMFYDVRNAEQLGLSLEAALKQGANALLINSEAVLIANRTTIIDFARKHDLPAMYSAREYTEAGGLVSYGVSYPNLYYRAASYVAKILKGAKPGELPIERPSKHSLVINIRAATAQGVAIPSPLLLRTDELIR